MKDTDNASVLWKKVTQCGIDFTNLYWIERNMTSRLNEAWEMFQRQASRQELAAVINLMPTLREEAWQQYRQEATLEEIKLVMDVVDEAWQLFIQQSSVYEIASAWHHLTRTQRMWQAWKIVRERGSNQEILWVLGSLQSDCMEAYSELVEEIWQTIRPRANREDLQSFIRLATDKHREEAWDDLKLIAEIKDLQEIVRFERRDKIKNEAAALLLNREPTRHNLWLIVVNIGDEEVTRRRWFCEKTVRRMATVKQKAIEILLQGDPSIRDLYRLQDFCSPHSDLRKASENKLKEALQSERSPVQSLLEELRYKTEGQD